MTLNIIIVASSTKYMVFIVLCCLINNISAQCWEVYEVHKGFRMNVEYTLDSLAISENVLPILDHSIALIDSSSFNNRKIWLYYVLCLNSRYDSTNQTTVRVELRQGVDYDILSLYLPYDGDRFSGAFCYKGFTFFVLCEHDNLPIYKELFKPKSKRGFPVYYNSSVIGKVWKQINYPYMESFVFLFYKYKSGVFSYSSTRVVE